MLINKEEFHKILNYASKIDVFTHVTLTDGRDFYFSEYADWHEIKKMCEPEDVRISLFELQFKSHVVTCDIEDAEAVYFVRSVMGRIGSGSKEYLTTGVLRDGVVHKTMWMTPELIAEKEYEDTIEGCFEEAMIYNVKGKNG